MRINRIVLHVKDVERLLPSMRCFGFRAEREEGDRIVELVSQDGGAHLLIDQAEGGQLQANLVFDVELLCALCEKAGLSFCAFIRATAMSSPMRATPPVIRSRFQIVLFAKLDERMRDGPFDLTSTTRGPK
jgi:hypothetical protein